MWERERDSREVRGHRADVEAAQPLGSDVRSARRGKAPRPWGAERAGIFTQDGSRAKIALKAGRFLARMLLCNFPGAKHKTSS